MTAPRILSLGGWRAYALLAIATALALLSGCVTQAPTEQIRYFSSAFTAVNTVGQPLLDDLAIAERARGRQVAVRRAKGESQVGADVCPQDQIAWQLVAGSQGFIRGYCLPDSGYFSELGDPPATARLRGGLAVIARYADVLSLLAEGRNIDGALGEVDALGGEVAGLLALGGVPAEPVTAALTALRPILRNAAQQSNADEARRLVLEGAPSVGALIGALRDAAPPMFDALIEPSAQKLVLLEPSPAVDAELARIDAYRVAVANYVVLLGRLEDAWTATVAATNAPPGRASLGTLVAQTSRIASDADAARKVFAILRSGGTPVGGTAVGR